MIQISEEEWKQIQAVNRRAIRYAELHAAVNASGGAERESSEHQMRSELDALTREVNRLPRATVVAAMRGL